MRKWEKREMACGSMNDIAVVHRAASEPEQRHKRRNAPGHAPLYCGTGAAKRRCSNRTGPPIIGNWRQSVAASQ